MEIPFKNALTRPRALTAIPKQWKMTAMTALYMSPALVLFVLFAYVPFIRSIWLSLHVTDAKGAIVKFNGLAYYARILGMGGGTEYLSSLWITLKFSLMVVLPGITLGVLLAALAAVKVRGIKFFRTLFTSSISISLASAGVIWAMIFSPTLNITTWLVELLKLRVPGLLANPETALPSIALATVWSGLGFNFIIALAGIQAIPQDVYESSALDGATGWAAFRHITLPLLSPTLFFLLVVDTIGSCQAFTQFNVLMGGPGPDSSTNVFILAAYKTFWLDNRYGFSSAMAIVLFVVLFALSIIQFRGLDKRVHYQ